MAGRRSAEGCRLLLGLAAAWVTLIASASERPWRILILNGTDPQLPAFVAIDRATRAALVVPDAHPVEIYSEALDMMRFPGAELEPEILALFRRKYASQRIDAVIAVTPAALDFAERHRGSLWPGAYIVFHSVSWEAVRGRTLLPVTTGVPLRHDVVGTAELALRLRPSSERVVVIGGSSDFDRYVIQVAREQLQPLAKRVAVEFWVDQSFEDLVDRIARLPQNTVVVLLAIDRDASGRMFVPRDACAQLAPVSSVPIFSVFETFVGCGIVGGSVDDYDRRGRRAAELVRAALSAPAAAAPPLPEIVPSICVADARQLLRWAISANLIPNGCTVRFAEPSPWERYRWQIVTGLAIIASQSLLIVALMLQRRQRRRAELDSQAARAELAHAARLTAMGELTASIAHEIKQPLSAILAHAETAEILLEAEAPPIPEVQRIVAEIRRDDLRASSVITRLRELLGKHAMEHRPLDLNDAIRSTLEVLDTEATRRGVRVESDLASGLPPILGDRVHLQQVVLNMQLNAMDALSGVAEGARRVAIRTASVREGVEMTVTDTGPGIDPAVAPRLFDSFVTTKRNGLGLGLSIARTIVEAHGGTIAVGAGPDGGAVFRVVLPAVHPGAKVVDGGLASARSASAA